MSMVVKVSNLESGISWSKEVNEDEYKKVENYLVTEPRRENTINNFFPMTNLAARVESAVGRILATIIAIIFDVVTLPFRLFVCGITETKKVHTFPLREYLKEQKVDEQLMESGYVKVRLEDKRSSENHSVDEKGMHHHISKTNDYWCEKNVRLIETPKYEGWDDAFRRGGKGSNGQSHYSKI